MIINRIKNYFISGLIVFLPLTLTVYALVILVQFADGFLGRYLKPWSMEHFGFYFQGLGILAAIYLIILTGFFATNFLGKKVYQAFENLLLRLPFFRQVYPAIKEMAVFLFSRDRLKSFKQAVLVEYPRKGVYAMGFLTNDSSGEINEIVGDKLVNVFIPSAPGPLTGYVVLVPKKDIIMTNISIEEAFKFIVSGGVVNPL